MRLPCRPVKPAPFEYHAPETVADVVGVLAEHGDEAKPLAGGQSLVPMLALRLTRFEHLVDLNRVAELSGVERRNGDGRGRCDDPAGRARAAPSDAAAVPLLAEAIPFIGHFQIRNRGTVGGSIAHADPAAELPAVALALDAQLEIARHRARRRDRGLGVLRRHLDHDASATTSSSPPCTSRSGRAAPASRWTRSPGGTATSRSSA